MNLKKHQEHQCIGRYYKHIYIAEDSNKEKLRIILYEFHLITFLKQLCLPVSQIVSDCKNQIFRLIFCREGE